MNNDIVARRWMITLPSAEYSKETVENQLKSYTYLGQLELADSGYEHWQIYIDNRGAGNVRFSTLKSKFPKGHFEKAIATPADCVAYVSKAETALGVVVQNGEIDTSQRPIGTQAVMARAHQMIVDDGLTADDVFDELKGGFGSARAIREIESFNHRRLAVEHAKAGGLERHVIFITGDPGVGKTSMVYQEHAGDMYSVSTYKHPFDEYGSENVLLLDEFAGQVEFELMLKILDRYPVNLPARYQNKFALYSRVYMLSNLRLEDLYRDIQDKSPRQWNALMRRIDKYQVMDADGSLTDVELPLIDIEDRRAA